MSKTNPTTKGSATGEVGIKRLYLHGLSIEATCPHCGELVTRYLRPQHLSHPWVGVCLVGKGQYTMRHEQAFEGDWLPEYEHEFEIEVKVVLGVEVREVPNDGG